MLRYQKPLTQSLTTCKVLLHNYQDNKGLPGIFFELQYQGIDMCKPTGVPLRNLAGPFSWIF